MMKFAADHTVGRLARWLRFIGYDTLYCCNPDEDQLRALADEGRILLSRNSSLVGKAAQDRFVFIEHNDPKEQLQEVVRSLDLRPDPDSFFTRCALCNGTLETVGPGDVYGKVPEYVWTVHERFSRCRGCGKIYWKGSHLTRARKNISQLLEV